MKRLFQFCSLALLAACVAGCGKDPATKAEVSAAPDKGPDFDTLMRTGVALRPAYAGTGFNENVRIFPDFAARLYFFEEVKHEEII